MMRLGLSDFELDTLIHLFDDLMNEVSKQIDLCIANEDFEEYEVANTLFALYWKMLRYLEFVRMERKDARTNS